MWKCTGCNWTGDHLVPVEVEAGIQGKVKSFACPTCGKTVGGGVISYDPPPEKPVEAEAELVSVNEDKPVEEIAPVKTPEQEKKPKRGFSSSNK